MSSEIKTTNILHPSSGSNNLVLGSDGTTTVSGALTASGGIANAGTISAGTIGDNVVRPNAIGFFATLDSTFSPSGTSEQTMTFASSNKFINGVTESSGVITLPTAGKYFAHFHGQLQTTADNNYIECFIQYKPSGGSFAQVSNTGAIGYQWNVSARSNVDTSCIIQASANSEVKMTFYSQGAGGSVYSGVSTAFSVFLIES
tara:strand:+ start:702 stop:1307 length:606 start_codon:yes stop_codon:yes gene_type:complete